MPLSLHIRVDEILQDQEIKGTLISVHRIRVFFLCLEGGHLGHGLGAFDRVFELFLDDLALATGLEHSVLRRDPACV